MDDDFEDETEDETEDDFDVDDWEYSDGFEEPSVALSAADAAPTMDGLAQLARRYNRRLRLDKKEAAVIQSRLKPKEKVLYITRADADLAGEFRNITFVLTDFRFFYLTNKRRFYSSSNDSFSSIWCDFSYTASVPLEKVTSVEYEDFGKAFGLHLLKIETADARCYEIQMPNYLFSKNYQYLKSEILEIFSNAVEGRKQDLGAAKKPGTDE